MMAISFFGQAREEAEAAHDWFEDQWERQDDHVRRYRWWSRIGRYPIYAPLAKIVDAHS